MFRLSDLRHAILLFAVLCWRSVDLPVPAFADEPKTDRTTADLVADLKPSIVVITFSGRDGKQEGLGTGFVVAEDGLIATNYHVIGEGRPIAVQFADGT